jgi:5-formyltetrahydrofolate cyclo-ligase
MPSSFPEIPAGADAAGKAAARVAARALRARLSAAARPDCYAAAARLFLDAVPRRADAAVALYWPLAGEFDSRPLLARLAEGGHACALPIADAVGAPLRFYRWRPGAALRQGRYGVMEPEAEAAEIHPDIVVMPCLAFDRPGYRLGYGGGYYDRTLASLRMGTRPVTAVLLAFAGQAVGCVPRGPHDQKADWIVTEDFAIASENVS